MKKKKILIIIVVILSLAAAYYYLLAEKGVATSYGDYVVRDKFYPPMCGIITVERKDTWWNKKIGSFKICEENVKNVYEKDGWVNVEIGCGQTWKKELKTGKVDIYTPENKCFHQIILD